MPASASRSALLSLIPLSTLVSTMALALPSAEKYADITKLGDASSSQLSDETQIPIFLADHDDPNVLYAPYDQVYLKEPMGAGADPRIKFGLAYDENGGFLSFTVRAGYSASRAAYIKRYQSEGKQVKPLTPISGGWTLTVNSKNSNVFIGATEDPKTVLPDTPTAMSVLIGPTAIQYIVSAYKTGASLGVNYNYTFRAVLTPFKMKASIHWQNLQLFLQNESKVLTKSQFEAKATFPTGPFGLFKFGTNVKASSSSAAQIRNVVKVGIERQWVKMWWRAGGGSMSEQARTDRLIDEVTKVVLSKVFKPIESKWAPIDAAAPSVPDCQTSVNGTGAAACYATGSSYVHNAEFNFEDKYYDYDITSEGIENLPGIVGSSFSYMCEDHPELFIHVRTGATGCPTKWDNDGKGIVTHLQPDAPPPVMPPVSPAAPPAASLNPPPDNF